MQQQLRHNAFELLTSPLLPQLSRCRDRRAGIVGMLLFVLHSCFMCADWSEFLYLATSWCYSPPLF